MEPRSSTRSLHKHCLAAAALALWPLGAAAQSNYSDKDFSVRLPPAFLRFTEVSTMGGETVANRYSSASNPASVGWTAPTGGLGIIAAPYYSGIGFQEGQWLHVTGESATVYTKDYGAFQPTLSQIRSSNDSLGHDDLSFGYDVDIAQFQWGKRYGDWAVGTMFNFARAEIARDGTQTTIVPGVGPVPVAVDSDASAESYRWRFGGLYQPAEKWLLGMIAEYGFAPYRSHNIAQVVGLPVPATIVDDQGFQQQFVLRPGVSYEYAPLSSVYADYQYGNFFNQRDSLVDHRFSVGVEHRLLEFLLVRGGPSMDARGNVGLSAGFSLLLGPNVSAEFGYQYNMMPELRPEFGKAQTLQGVLSFRF
jgi:hypothetical protein